MKKEIVAEAVKLNTNQFEIDINEIISTDKLKETIYDLLPEDSLFGESFKVDRNNNKIDKEQFLNTIQIDTLNNNAIVIHNVEKFIDDYFIAKILVDLKYQNITNDPNLDYQNAKFQYIGTPETQIDKNFRYKSPIIITNSEQTLNKTIHIVREWESYNEIKSCYNTFKGKEKSDGHITLSQYNQNFNEFEIEKQNMRDYIGTSPENRKTIDRYEAIDKTLKMFEKMSAEEVLAIKELMNSSRSTTYSNKFLFEKDKENPILQAISEKEKEKIIEKEVKELSAYNQELKFWVEHINKDIQDYEKKKSILLPDARKRQPELILNNITKLKIDFDKAMQTTNLNYGKRLNNATTLLYEFIKSNFDEKTIQNISNFEKKYKSQSRENTR